MHSNSATKAGFHPMFLKPCPAITQHSAPMSSAAADRRSNRRPTSSMFACTGRAVPTREIMTDARFTDGCGGFSIGGSRERMSIASSTMTRTDMPP
jgi:hypothetical protein